MDRLVNPSRFLAITIALSVLASATMVHAGRATQAQLPTDTVPASAAVETASTAPAAVDEEDDERLICRRERAIGSNRVTRVCRTAKQLQEERDAAQKAVREGQVPGSSY